VFLSIQICVYGLFSERKERETIQMNRMDVCFFFFFVVVAVFLLEESESVPSEMIFMRKRSLSLW